MKSAAQLLVVSQELRAEAREPRAAAALHLDERRAGQRAGVHEEAPGGAVGDLLRFGGRLERRALLERAQEAEEPLVEAALPRAPHHVGSQTRHPANMQESAYFA